MPPSQEKQNSKKNRPIDDALKYSGMAFQLGITLAIGTFAGTKIDQRLQTERPYFTALFAILSLFAGLYLVLKDLFRKPPSSDPTDQSSSPS